MWLRIVVEGLLPWLSTVHIYLVFLRSTRVVRSCVCVFVCVLSAVAVFLKRGEHPVIVAPRLLLCWQEEMPSKSGSSTYEKPNESDAWGEYIRRREASSDTHDSRNSSRSRPDPSHGEQYRRGGVIIAPPMTRSGMTCRIVCGVRGRSPSRHVIGIVGIVRT